MFMEFVFCLLYLFAGVLDMLAAVGIGETISEHKTGRSIDHYGDVVFTSVRKRVLVYLAVFGLIVLWPITVPAIVIYSASCPEEFAETMEQDDRF